MGLFLLFSCMSRYLNFFSTSRFLCCFLKFYKLSISFLSYVFFIHPHSTGYNPANHSFEVVHPKVSCYEKVIQLIAVYQSKKLGIISLRISMGLQLLTLGIIGIWQLQHLNISKRIPRASVSGSSLFLFLSLLQR